MAKRLNQVAKELNIGISTIVDFLSKKGFNIKASINTKINEEQYNLLCKAFSTDALVKKIASKRNNLQLNLDDFIEHYNPINTEEKINELFKIYCETFHQPINEQQLDKLYQKCDNNLHTYIKSVYDNYQEKASQLKVSKKGKKRFRNKGHRRSESPFNKNGYVFKRVHIISTPM